MSSHRKYFLLGVMTSFALLEFLMLSYLQSYFGIYFSPIIFFISSLGVSVVALYFSVNLSEVKKTTPTSKSVYYLFLPLLFVLLYFGYSVFSKQPIDYNDSDIFAQVISPSEWLLKGEYPYQTVVLPSYSMHNTYLPMQWFPFLLSVGFGFDARWIPLLAWVVTLLLFIKYSGLQFNLTKEGRGKVAIVVIAFLSVFVIFGFIDLNSFDYCVSLELLPAAYYILFTLALLRGSWWAIGITSGICLMSRFSIILLAPFLIWYVWKRFGWNVLWKSGATTVVFIMAIFVLPFMTKDPQLPYKILGNYDSGAVGEWRVHDWQEPGTEPYQIARGMGAAIFVKKLYEYDIKDGVHHLKQAEIVLSLLVTLFLIYFSHRNYSFLNRDWVLLGGLKLYLTIFYTLVLIPYPYLFLLPVTVTVLLLLKAYADIFSVASLAKEA
ncbi:MAG: hypothetical protein H7X99_06065 [Saprospiraceae bacterium]|nr:hypothetical protein [Saprospiraceae bacterium]